MSDEKQHQRSLLRRVLDYVTGRGERPEGVRIGEPKVIPLGDMLNDDDDDSEPMRLINVSVELKDATAETIEELDDAIDTALRNADLGEWVGAGTFSDETGDVFRDIDYEVTDEEKAVELIRKVVVEWKAPTSTRIGWKDGVEYPMRDEPPPSDTS